MPSTIKFPGEFDDDNSLYLAVNNLRTRLTSSITDTDTTIPVLTTSGFPGVGFVTILTGADITKAEAIAYSGTGPTDFFNAERGSDGTAALPHNPSDFVDGTIVARHHNNAKDAIIAIEHFLGVSGSENFVPKDQYGNVVISGALTLTTGTITAPGGIFSETLTISGSPVLTSVSPDGHFSNSLTVSGIPVLTSLSTNFVPKDEFGNVVITGTLIVTDDVTISGSVEQGATLVTGTLAVCSGVDFKADLTISGCISVGFVPASTAPQATYSFVDTIFTTGTTAVYEETGVSIVPDAGVNLVLFRANCGSGPSGLTSGKIKASYAGTDIAESTGNVSSGASLGHWNSTEMSGFKIITTNAVDPVKLHAASNSTPREVEVGAQQLISVPLGTLGLVEGTDYWFDNGSDSFVAIPAASGTDVVTVNEITFTAPVTGPYLLLGHCEAKLSNFPANVSYRVYYYVNETNVSNHVAREGDVSGVTSHTMPWAQVVNLTAGENNISVRVGRWNTTNAFSYKRARIALINGAAFNSLTGTRTFTDYATSSTTFSEMSALAQTHTPTSQTQVLVIGSTVTNTTDTTDPRAIPTIKIRDDTDAVDYATDWGEGHVLTNSNLPWTGFAIKDNVTSATDWKMFVREANGTGNIATVNHSAMVVWDLSAPQPEQTLLTTICKDKITTPDLCADNITVINSGTLTIDIGGELISPVGTFSESLTISGVPVATGTSGGGGGASTLQEAYDNGDGTIATVAGKPFELTGKGELVAVTGTFATELTISGQPVATGTHTTINGLGGVITLQEAGSVFITQNGQVITISGSATGGGGGGATSCFTHVQSTASAAWVVTHNLGTEVVNYIVLDTADSQVEPDSFTVDTQDQVTITFVAPQDGIANIFPCFTATGTTLQEAYDLGDGSIVTVPGKPVLISGAEGDNLVDFRVVGSGIFTEALQVGEGSTYINDHLITTASGVFQSLTISGTPVPLTGGGSALTVQDIDGTPIVSNVNTIKFTNGAVTDGGSGVVTVSVGAGGGGGGELTTSGYWFNPEAMPVVTHPKSDWFDDNSGQVFVQGVPSGIHYIDTTKWSLWDVDAVSGTNNGFTAPSQVGDTSASISIYDTNHMRVNHTASTVNGWLGWYQDAPSGNFTITSRVGQENTFDINFDFKIGIFIADDLAGAPSTSDLISCTLNSIAGTTGAYSQYQGALWTDYNSISTQSTTTPGPFPGNSAWLRLNYNASGPTIEVSISEDGISWRELRRFIGISFTPSHIGFGVQCGSTGQAFNGSFHFFAVYPSNLRGTAAGYGRLVPTVISGSSGGGGGASTLQEAYDGGDGTISTTGGKPFVLTGTGELVAVTGTFTSGLTVGGASTFIDGGSITTASGIFETLTVSGVSVNTNPLTGKASFRGARVELAVDQTVTTATSHQVIYDTTIFDTEGFVVGGDQSYLVVPEGVSKIRLRSQTYWISNNVGIRQNNIRKGTFPGAGGFGAAIWEGFAQSSMQATSPVIDVVPGDQFSVLARQESGGNLDLDGSTASLTWFEVEVIEDQQDWIVDEFTATSGTFTQSLTISGVPVATGTGPFYGIFSMETSATQSLASTSTTSNITSLTKEIHNEGGFILQPNGIVEVPSNQGYTHVKLQGDIAFADNSAGGRHLAILMNGASFFTNSDGQVVGGAQVRQDPQSFSGVCAMQVHSPIVTVSGGDQFNLSAAQTSGGNLDVVGGGGAEGTLTALLIQGFKR